MEKEYDRVANNVIRDWLLKQCRVITSVRKGSFFEHSYLMLKSFIDILYYW